jgi:hypothetical protein
MVIQVAMDADKEEAVEAMEAMVVVWADKVVAAAVAAVVRMVVVMQRIRVASLQRRTNCTRNLLIIKRSCGVVVVPFGATTTPQLTRKWLMRLWRTKPQMIPVMVLVVTVMLVLVPEQIKPIWNQAEVHSVVHCIFNGPPFYVPEMDQKTACSSGI